MTVRQFKRVKAKLTDGILQYSLSLIGYDDPNQFSQAFAKIVGMPPSKYRELSVWPFRLNKK